MNQREKLEGQKQRIIELEDKVKELDGICFIKDSQIQDLKEKLSKVELDLKLVESQVSVDHALLQEIQGD